MNRMRKAIAAALFAFGCQAAGAVEDNSAPAALTPAKPSVPTPPQKPTAPKPALPPPEKNGCPVEMARVGKACVDRWEAHLVGNPHHERPKKGQRAASAPGVFPQPFISKNEAAAACQASGKRLCTLSEWYAACRGSEKKLYGYANDYAQGRCNAGKPHLLGRLFGNNPKKWTFDEHFNSPKLAKEPGFLARSGDHAECTNDYGVFDMIGNLHEWVSDRVDHSLVNKIPLRDDIRGKIDINMGHAIFMGGFFSTTSEHGRGCTFLTPGHGPKYHDYSTGFRCCRDAK